MFLALLVVLFVMGWLDLHCLACGFVFVGGWLIQGFVIGMFILRRLIQGFGIGMFRGSMPCMWLC